MKALNDVLLELGRHEWLVRGLIALTIAVIGIWLARWPARALDKILHRFDVEVILRSFLRNLAYAVGIIVVCIAALDFAGVPTTSLLAVLGAAGLAIGLAMKDSLSNIASGVMLIVLRPFHSGDYVQVAGIEGIIDSVRIFQTHLHTQDNRQIILPNSQITTVPIINFTVRGVRRLDVAVKISYNDDMALARKTLLDIAKKHSQILSEPPAEVIVSELADIYVQLQLRVWLAAADHGSLKAYLLEQCWSQLGAQGFKTAYPQQHMHVHHHGKTEGLCDEAIASV
ncbi:MAG: mechanosensitive ion channel domain-containing protein [Arenimonas sp.]